MRGYSIGDKFVCPHDKSYYTIKYIGIGTDLMKFDLLGKDEHQEWECGSWYFEQCIREGNLFLVERACTVELDEDLFTV